MIIIITKIKMNRLLFKIKHCIHIITYQRII
jgi:hypothetical protein